MPFKASLKLGFSMHRFLPLRKRYLFTRGNRVRLRYIAPCASLLVISAFAFMPNMTVNSFNHDNVFASLSPSTGEALVLNENKSGILSHMDLDPSLQSGVSEGMRNAQFAMQKPKHSRYRELEIQSGETVAGVLQEAGLSGPDAYNAVEALGKYYDVRKVKSGQKIDLHFKPDENGDMQFSKLAMKLDAIKEVSVEPADDATFKAEISEKELFPRTYARKAEIKTSLYGSAARANIPSSVIANMIKIYSWNIDFQRDIRSGDKLEVLYEAFETEDGEFAKYGNVLYANLNVGGREYPIYRFEMSDGRVDYFDPKGMSTRKTLMKTPIDGARISSGFGMRRHPVLGYSKMHKGMDFAASTGTPIYAAGDGVVEYSGRFSSYGNYVRIRHNSKLKTAYAHMHKIDSSVKVGSRVRQGQVIGAVGTTGRSTGPHLHYEVLVNGTQTDPRSMKLPTGEQLAGKQMSRFKAVIAELNKQYVSLSNGLKFASAQKEDADTTIR